MVRIAVPGGGSRLGWMVLGLVAGALSATIMHAQQPPAQQAQAAPTAASSSPITAAMLPSTALQASAIAWARTWTSVSCHGAGSAR